LNFQIRNPTTTSLNSS